MREATERERENARENDRQLRFVFDFVCILINDKLFFNQIDFPGAA